MIDLIVACVAMATIWYTLYRSITYDSVICAVIATGTGVAFCSYVLWRAGMLLGWTP